MGVFLISQFLVNLFKINYHNSRTGNDIDMKIGPMTAHHKRNKTMSNKIDNDFILANFDVIVIFPIYG